MLINTNHQASDQRPTDSSDTTQHPTPLHRRPYWNQTIAAFSASLWLPAGTTDRGSLINTAHGWTSKHRGPFMVLCEPHRGPQPRPAQTLFDSRGAGHDRAHHRWRHQATGSPDTGLSRPHPAALPLAGRPDQPHCQGTQPTQASQMRWAQARMRQRITNLVDELHWQLARWLTSTTGSSCYRRSRPRT